MPAPLSRYKDACGKPREGLHSARLFGFAAADVLLTLAVGIALSALLACLCKSCSFFLLLLVVVPTLFLLAVLVHRLFGVNTALNTMIFGKV